MNIIDDAISTEATRKNVRLMIPVMIHWAKTGHNEHTPSLGLGVEGVGSERSCPIYRRAT